MPQWLNWVASDKSSTKPLLVKFQSLLMLQPPRLNVAATYTQTQQRMGPRHLGFVEQASKGNIDFLLEGDSITDWWVQGDANQAVFNKYFGNIRRPISRLRATPRKESSGA